MFESGLTSNSVNERLLARLLARADVIYKEGLQSLFGFSISPIKKRDLKLETRLSKALKKDEASAEKFYQEVKISIPPRLKEKTLKEIETIRKKLRISYRNRF